MKEWRVRVATHDTWLIWPALDPERLTVGQDVWPQAKVLNGSVDMLTASKGECDFHAVSVILHQ